MSPEDVAKSFFQSVEFGNRNLSNADYVETLYQTFMDRASDEAGKADWVGRLNNGTDRNEVLEGFSRSQEFAAIMESFGLSNSTGGTSGSAGDTDENVTFYVVKRSNEYFTDGELYDYVEYEYDAFGNETQQICYNADGTLNSRGVYEYDGAGNCTKYTCYDADGNVEYYEAYEYDGSGHNTQYTWYGADGIVRERAKYEYDESGRMKRARYYDTDLNLVEREEYEHDTIGNIKRRTCYDADGSIMNEVSFENVYDASLNLVRRTCYHTDGSMSYYTTYEYDNLGNMVCYIYYDASGTLTFKQVNEYISITIN
jgi:hypothetical protein